MFTFKDLLQICTKMLFRLGLTNFVLNERNKINCNLKTFNNILGFLINKEENTLAYTDMNYICSLPIINVLIKLYITFI